jgi:hypothetical protein
VQENLLNMKINRKLRLITRVYRLLLSFYNPRIYLPFFVCSLLLSLIACTEDKEATFSETPAEQPEFTDSSIKSEAAETPQRSIKFSLDHAPAAVQLVASVPNLEIRLSKLTAPDGEVLFDAARIVDTNITSAANFQASPLTYNYPLLSTQTPLTAGEYTAEYETRDPNNQESTGAEISLAVVVKDDADLQNGTINLNIILGGIASNNDEIRNGIEDAINLMSIMLERYGIGIYANIIPLPESPEVLPNPQTGDTIYEEASKESDNGINIFIVNNIENFNAERYNSVIAGSSPGPLIPSPRSAIAVSLSIATGNDGKFDADADDPESDNLEDSEKRIFAESLTHELLRYMGLKNSVTFNSNEVSSTDGLDSEKCSNINSCEDSEEANGNLMFPYALPKDDFSGEKFYPRDRLSPQQVELAQRYVGIN